MIVENATVSNRFAHLTPEEVVMLAFLDCDHPGYGLEADPAEWPEWTDQVWEPNEPLFPPELVDPFDDDETPLPGECPELPFDYDFEPAELEDWHPDPQDTAEAARLFGTEEDRGDVILDDDERPRDTWTPSRIAAHELAWQERR